MKKYKNWIKSAIQKPGALHRQLKVPAGKKIPASKLAKAADKGGKLGRRARLAQTLKSFKHKKSPKFKIPESIKDIGRSLIRQPKVPALTYHAEEVAEGNDYTLSRQTSPYKAQNLVKNRRNPPEMTVTKHYKKKSSGKTKHKFSLSGMFRSFRRPSANPKIPSAAVKIAPAGSLFNQHAQQLKEAMAYKRKAAKKK